MPLLRNDGLSWVPFSRNNVCLCGILRMEFRQLVPLLGPRTQDPGQVILFNEEILYFLRKSIEESTFIPTMVLLCSNSNRTKYSGYLYTYTLCRNIDQDKTRGLMFPSLCYTRHDMTWPGCRNISDNKNEKKKNMFSLRKWKIGQLQGHTNQILRYRYINQVTYLFRLCIK